MGIWANGLLLLHTIVNRPGDYGVRGLARELAIPKSTVHRVLEDLTQSGYVRTNADGKLLPGIRFIQMAAIAMRSFSLRSYALPFLKEIVERFNETVYFYAYDTVKRKLIAVDCIECTHRVRYFLQIGEELDPYCGVGKAALAHLPEAEVAYILERSEMKPITPTTITDPVRLRADLAETRRRGYSVSYGERTYELVAFASALLDRDGQVVGALALNVNKVRFESETEALYGEEVHMAALALSRLLGYQGES